MKKLTILIVVGLLCLFFQARSQFITTQNGLKVGDKVPDVTLSHILNYPQRQITLSNLKAKLIILDFWATWCSNCIQEFPRTESLQKEFGSKLFILGVAYEPTEKIRKFFSTAKDPLNKPYNFPCTTADVTLAKLFPHQSLPHYVWIGPDGRVKAISGADEITRENIKAALLPEKLNIPQKDDIDPSRALFINEHVKMDSLAHFALLYHHHFEGAGNAITYRQVGDRTRGIAVCNQPILRIYETAIQHLFEAVGQRYFPNRLVIESRDSIELKRSLWSRNGILPNKKDLYSYDLILPLARADRLYEEMLADLNQNSGYSGLIEQRYSSCLVLKRTSAIDRMKSRSDKRLREYHETSFRLYNAPFSVFYLWLNDNNIVKSPVFDETGYSGQVDIDLANITSLESLNNALSKYDLELVRENRRLYVFVLSDKSSLKLSSQSLNAKP